MAPRELLAPLTLKGRCNKILSASWDSQHRQKALKERERDCEREREEEEEEEGSERTKRVLLR
jgi:hypothetical protein